MGQVTVYMDPLEIEYAKAAASAEKTSLSKWLTALVQQKRAAEQQTWPADFWTMAGAWRNEEFPDLEAMRRNETPQVPRETF